MNYPNGLKKTNQVSITTHKNRGMNLENELNISNEYYRAIDKAYIYKKPTPIKIVTLHQTFRRRFTVSVVQREYFFAIMVQL